MNAIETYLLDTNTISDIARGNVRGDSPCLSRFRVAVEQGAYVILPVMSIAEIETGLQQGGDPDSDQARDLRRFFRSWPHAGFDDNTVRPYALIRSRLFQKFGTPKTRPRKVKETQPEELIDRVTGKELGIDERDLLIASTAVVYNFILVTADENEGMRRIRGVAELLAAEGLITPLRVENWRRNDGSGR